MSRFKVDSYNGGSTYTPVPLCRTGASGDNCVHLRFVDTKTTDEYIVEVHWDAKGALDLRYWIYPDPKYKEKIPLSTLAVVEGLAKLGTDNE
jgi:hypothetical protein